MTFLFRKPDPSSRLCHFAATATATDTAAAAAAAPHINGISTHFRPNPLQSLPQNPPHSAIGRPEKTLPPISPISRSFSSSSDSENPISPPHSGDADKICEVINGLFSSDRNMESVLSNLHIQIESPLVLAVLNRFRHTHRPAHRFFRWASSLPNFSHDSSSYNMMLAILGKTRQFETMVALLEEMGDEGFLSVDAFKISIKAFAAAREMKKCVGIFKLIRKFDFDVELDTFNCLIDALSKAKLAREAKQLLERMRDRYSPDLRTYTALLYGFCKIKDLAEAGMVWNEMLDGGFKPDIVAHNTMLEGLIRGNRKSEGIKLFELMKAKGPVPNTRTYTILIQHFCKGGKMEQAVSCFDDMLAACCLPDVATYTCLIIGFGNAREMSKVSSLLADMSRKGCPPDARTYNALIKLMTNRNMPDDAVRIYKKMVRNGFEPTLHTYNMMMKCYFHGNDYKMGCAVWEEMLAKGICPDVNSFTVFIGGHIRYGSPEEAYKYIEEMINKGMSVPQVDYNKLAADFSRVGRPDVLGELAQKMSFIGKFDASKVLNCWSERMKKRVKRR